MRQPGEPAEEVLRTRDGPTSGFILNKPWDQREVGLINMRASLTGAASFCLLVRAVNILDFAQSSAMER